MAVGSNRIPVMKREALAPKSMARLVYQADPIRESVEILGAKWTLLILRDIAFLKLDRFGKILRNNPGLTARVLSRRLKNMRVEGLLKRVTSQDVVTYQLTTKGEDAIFVLLAFLRYGLRHHGPSWKGETSPGWRTTEPTPEQV